MSDSIKAWREMQEEKLVSLKADEAIAKTLVQKNKLDKNIIKYEKINNRKTNTVHERSY